MTELTLWEQGAEINLILWLEQTLIYLSISRTVSLSVADRVVVVGTYTAAELTPKADLLPCRWENGSLSS